MGAAIYQAVCALTLVTPVGGLILWLCCWLYNHMAGVYRPPRAKSLPKSESFKTIDDIPPEIRYDESNHPDAVPLPSYPWSCLIIFCSAPAWTLAANGIVQLVVWSFGGKESPQTFNTIWGILPPMTLLIHTTVVALMLPTSFLKSLGLTFVAILPNAAACIALICICWWKEFVPH